MKTNNPNGRPKTAPDGKRREPYTLVTASPSEALALDAHRREDETRAEMVRRVVGAAALDPHAIAAEAAREKP